MDRSFQRPRCRNSPGVWQSDHGRTAAQFRVAATAKRPGRSRQPATISRRALELEPDPKCHRASITEVAVGQQWVSIDAVRLCLVEQVLSFEGDTELVVDIVRNVCGHPGKRVGKL